MPPDRLTIERARPGMPVVCVDAKHTTLRLGNTYIVERRHAVLGEVYLQGDYSGSYRPSRFIPADPPAPALTPGLIEALRETHFHWRGAGKDHGPLVARLKRLLDAIEAAGILDKPARTTEREATIREGWWV